MYCRTWCARKLISSRTFRNIIYLVITQFALVMRILLAKPQLGKNFKYLVDSTDDYTERHAVS